MGIGECAEIVHLKTIDDMDFRAIFSSTPRARLCPMKPAPPIRATFFSFQIDVHAASFPGYELDSIGDVVHILNVKMRPDRQCDRIVADARSPREASPSVQPYLSR